ncbi:MAG: SH3 domain-containing protein, partial [Nitrospinae bacterium]|nr:SH3 domain-containing protein [Nitrospinota bacterium]
YQGHSNLGLVYENQDMISQALQEFEKAYRLQPTDPKIRQNMVRAMRFKANLYHENREYFKTLEILARLEQIVPAEEKQGVLFKQEQVEDQIFLQVLKTDDMAAYQDFIQRFPDGLNAVRAREYLEKNAHQVSRANPQKKNRQHRQSGMIQSVESGNLSAGASSQAPPDYGAPSYYGSSQPSATYTPPSAPPAQVAGSKKKKFDIFGLDPAATESISEETITAPQAAVAENRIAIPFEDFEKPERIGVDTAKDPKQSPGEDPTDRTQPEVLADLPDTGPDLESSQPVAAESKAADTQLEQTKETEPVASAEPVEAVAPAMAEAPKAEPKTPAEPEVDVAAIVQAIKEAEAELAQAEKEKDAGASEKAPATQTAPSEPEVAQLAAQESPEEPPMAVASLAQETQTAPAMEPPASAPAEKTAIPPAPSAAQAIDKESIAQTVASLIPTPQPQAAGPANTVVVIQVAQGSTLNVRAEASASGEILGYLENGDMMPYVQASGGWYQIKIDEGLFGWVSSKFATTRTLVSDVPLAFEGEAETQAGATQVPAPAADDSQTATPMVEITVGEDSTLNVRSMPSSEGAVVDMLTEGDTLPLIKESGDWYQLQFEDGSTGWVSKRFSRILNTGTEAETPFPEVETGGPVTASPAQNPKIPVTTVVVITVKEGSSLRVRAAPSSQGEVLGSLQSGDMRPLLEELGDWYQVEFQDGQSGWVSQKFSSKIDVGSNVIPQP